MSGPHRLWLGAAEDSDALARLHSGAMSDAWPAPAFASLLSRDEVFVLLGAAGDSRSPQGFILVRIVADEAEVLTFCVAEDVRRGGLGTALLEAACDIVQRRGGVQILLEVSQVNVAALTLYRKCGFAEVGRRAAYYRQGSLAADALVMRKPIATVSASVHADVASSFPAGPESTKRE